MAVYYIVKKVKLLLPKLNHKTLRCNCGHSSCLTSHILPRRYFDFTLLYMSADGYHILLLYACLACQTI